MLEQWKIAVLYRDRAPQLFAESTLEAMPWKFEYLREHAVLGGPVLPARDYLAVFYCLENETPEIVRHVSNLFPGAEILGYRDSAKSSSVFISRSEDGMQVITAEAPQAEMFRYSSELRSMTQGRGSFEMEFTRYDVVPANVAQKVIAESQKNKKAEEE
jgi:hypothetical protein